MNPETFSYLLPATARDWDRESRERSRRSLALSGSEKVESKLNSLFPPECHTMKLLRRLLCSIRQFVAVNPRQITCNNTKNELILMRDERNERRCSSHKALSSVTHSKRAAMDLQCKPWYCVSIKSNGGKSFLRNFSPFFLEASKLYWCEQTRVLYLGKGVFRRYSKTALMVKAKHVQRNLCDV